MGLNNIENGDIILTKINTKLSGSEKEELTKDVQMIFQDPAASLNER
jgi:oligopeptide transport system ATP-binding protein